MTGNVQGIAGDERLHGLDAVRGLALLGGVALHAAMSFLPGPQLWIVKDLAESVELGVGFFVLHIFRMAVFFLLAGFFGRMLLQRRGAGGFVKDRLKRIAAPLVIFWPVVFPAIVAVLIWGAIQANGGVVPQNAPPPPPMTVGTFPLTHLWFLYLLLIFYAAALPVRGLVAAGDRSGRLRAGVDRLVRWIVGHWAPVLVAAPLAAVLALDPAWLPWFGVKTPDTGLVPNGAAMVAYGSAFAIGWLLHRQADLLQVCRRWPFHLLLAAGFTVACLAMAGVKPALAPEPDQAVRWAYAACYAMALWSWTFGLVGLGMAAFSGRSAVRRYLADASYWVYLVHLPVVMALQVLVAPLSWPWPLKFAVIVGVAMALLLGSYQLFVRHSAIGGLLNGRRAPKPSRANAAPAVPEPV